MDEFYIESGVHRAVAAREAGLFEIRAVVYIPGSPPLEMMVPLSALHANRRSVSRRINRRRNLPGLIRAMSDSAARESVPRIELQRLGEFAQPKTVPLIDVRITAENVEEDA